ncbi:hypothetical protein ACHAWF_014555 [Thalassiosira exigua]
MSISKSRSDEVNARMARVAPELSSPYAKYPLSASGGRKWVSPGGGTTPKGEPCWIQGQGKATAQTPRRDHYVYGPGSCEFGYYHLLTRDSYNILFVQLQNKAPTACCAFGTETRRRISDHDEVQRLCYNRSIYSVPDDEQATKESIAIARGEAKAAYHCSQNEQIIFGLGHL